MEIKKVCLYLRKSRNDTDLSLDLVLKRHYAQLTDLCKRQGLTIIETYKEIVSADTIEKRPQMQALLNDVLDGLYYAVVVMDLDRLSRGNQVDQLEILETFKSSNTLIITPSKTYDLRQNDYDEDFFDFALFMSRQEYKVIKRRLMRGKKQAIKEGYYIAPRLPFGYSKEKRGRGYVLIPNDKAVYVKDIFSKYASGVKSMEICQYLNTLGVTTAQGGAFDDEKLKRILRNATYIGKINTNVHGNLETYDGKHAPIIDKELYYKVQERLASKSTKQQKSKQLINPLATLFKCNSCGRTMQLSKVYGYVYLVCPNVNCDTKSSSLESVENRLIKELSAALKDYKYIVTNYDSFNTKDSIENEKKALNKEIEKIKGMLDKACDMLELGVYSKEKYLERTDKLTKNMDMIQERLKELSAVSEDKNNLQTAIPIIEKVINDYNLLSPTDKNKLLKAILSKVVYHKGKLDKDFTLDIYTKV